MSVAFVSFRHHLALVTVLALSAIAGPGCKAHPPVVAATEVVTTLAIPAWTNEGPGREVETLLESEVLKVAAIALRRGTELPVHSVESRVSITVLRGAGVMTVDDETIDVAAGSVLIVGPSVAHAMKPADEQLVVLLVHHLDPPTSSANNSEKSHEHHH